MFWEEVWAESQRRPPLRIADGWTPGPVRSLREALLRGPSPAVIAEFKRASPSRGVIRTDVSPGLVAAAYRRGGAAAVSVLTEPRYFGGDPADLREVREAVDIPVLRKDFILTFRQVEESRAAGADAVLLIVAGLGGRLSEMLAAVREIGLEALVECHTAAEIELAIGAGAEIIGVNTRDLRSLEVRPETLAQLAPMLPATAVAVAESGIRGPEDARRAAELGYRAVLVGEHLMRSPDPVRAVRELGGWDDVG